MNATDPRLEIAFEASLHDPAAVRNELARVTAGLARARLDPNATPQVIQALEQEVARWQVAADARKILLQAHAAIVKKANRPQVDPDMTADRALVTAAMKGANVGPVTADPPPQLGLMSDAEFRQFKAQFGF
jgi:hypothetical protein